MIQAGVFSSETVSDLYDINIITSFFSGKLHCITVEYRLVISVQHCTKKTIESI